MALEHTLIIETNAIKTNRIDKGISKQYFLKSILIEIPFQEGIKPHSIFRKANRIQFYFNGYPSKKSKQIPDKAEYFEWYAHFNPHNSSNGYDRDFFSFYDRNKNILNEQELINYIKENGL